MTATQGIFLDRPVPRVMVVEDEPEARDRIVLSLRRSGCEAIPVERSADAVDHARDCDAALVDALLQHGADGIWAHRNLRKIRGRDLFIVGWTSYFDKYESAFDQADLVIAKTGNYDLDATRFTAAFHNWQIDRAYQRIDRLTGELHQLNRDLTHYSERLLSFGLAAVFLFFLISILPCLVSVFFLDPMQTLAVGLLGTGLWIVILEQIGIRLGLQTWTAFKRYQGEKWAWAGAFWLAMVAAIVVEIFKGSWFH